MNHNPAFFSGPSLRSGGRALSASDRKAWAMMHGADLLIALVPDSTATATDTKIGASLTTKPLSLSSRTVGSWTVGDITATAGLIARAISADTAFRRVSGSRR